MPDERPTCPACRQEIRFIGAGCQTCEIERLNTRVAELETVRDRSAAYAGEKAREIELLTRRLKDASGIIHNIREAWRVDGEKWEQDKRAIEYLTERLAKCEPERDELTRERDGAIKAHATAVVEWTAARQVADSRGLEIDNLRAEIKRLRSALVDVLEQIENEPAIAADIRKALAWKGGA